MSRGDNKPEHYELDSAELFFCRTEAILRAIYYMYKDMELKQEANHEALESLVNCLIYNVFAAEDKIKEKSVNVPIELPPTDGHSEKYAEMMMENLDHFYTKQREKAHARIHENKKK
jgi:hypothetical protein